jgi:hypothetical protein
MVGSEIATSYPACRPKGLSGAFPFESFTALRARIMRVELKKMPAELKSLYRPLLQLNDDSDQGPTAYTLDPGNMLLWTPVSRRNASPFSSLSESNLIVASIWRQRIITSLKEGYARGLVIWGGAAEDFEEIRDIPERTMQ